MRNTLLSAFEIGDKMANTHLVLTDINIRQLEQLIGIAGFFIFII